MKKLISAVVVLFVVAFAAVAALKFLPGSPFSNDTSTNTTQVINAVTREQQVVLLALGIQGITETERNSEVFGMKVPGSTEKVLLQYNFNAKVGIDGKDVTVKKTGREAFQVSIPSFIFIGHSDEQFKTVLDDGGVLSFTTPDIDKAEMINQILNDDAQQQYITSNVDTLKEQATSYYTNLIGGIDPKATVTVVFADALQ